MGDYKTVTIQELKKDNPTLCLSAKRVFSRCNECPSFKRVYRKYNHNIIEAKNHLECNPIIDQKRVNLLEKKQRITRELNEINKQLGE